MCISFLSLASNRQSEVRDEKIKEMKEKYETQLNGLKKELKHLEIAKRDHTIALKKNVSDIHTCVCSTCTCMHVHCMCTCFHIIKVLQAAINLHVLYICLSTCVHYISSCIMF